ncbi:MAG: hypothetical protein PHO02_01310 [Candidatus Nanoarchaeia archaeon]|nr:hypothetical protein [Candidatus Nanoarchaeia archaeon]
MIKGSRYDFEICADKGFFIKAICRKSGRYSCVTNVNIILSSLSVDGRRFDDTSWNVNNTEAAKFKAKAIEFLSNNEFLVHVEDALDEDRACGEWENKERKGEPPA